jgi:hypothetical protein
MSLRTDLAEAVTTSEAINILKRILTKAELELADRQILLHEANPSITQIVEDLDSYGPYNGKPYKILLTYPNDSIKIREVRELWINSSNVHLKAYIVFNLKATRFKQLSYIVLFEIHPLLANNWKDFSSLMQHRVFRDDFMLRIKEPVGKNLFTPFFLQLMWGKEINLTYGTHIADELTRSFIESDNKTNEEKLRVIKAAFNTFYNRRIRLEQNEVEAKLIDTGRKLLNLDGLPDAWVKEVLGV